MFGLWSDFRSVCSPCLVLRHELSTSRIHFPPTRRTSPERRGWSGGSIKRFSEMEKIGKCSLLQLLNFHLNKAAGVRNSGAMINTNYLEILQLINNSLNKSNESQLFHILIKYNFLWSERILISTISEAQA